MENKPEDMTIEARLHDAAPLLPPELRPQILRRCEQERQHKPIFARLGQWRWTGAVTGFALVCWMVSSRLDAQSQAMVAGNSKRQTGMALALRAGILTPTQTDSQSFGLALRRRMQQLTLLLHDRHSG